MEVKLVARTCEVDSNNIPWLSPDITHDFDLFAGKAAGICYSGDNYFTEVIKDDEKSLKRAEGTKKHAHNTTFEHTTVSLLITAPKIIAMMLNNTKLYNTSERSARYTKMKFETSHEEELYNKWVDKFSKVIKASFPSYTDNEIHKLAMENARYLTSIFTETTFMFTVNYARLAMILKAIDKIELTLNKAHVQRKLKLKLKDSLLELKEGIIEAVGLKDYESFKDPYNFELDLFKPDPEINNNNGLNVPFYRRHYTVQYEMSFAALAQAQRHRTIDYHISANSARILDLGLTPYIPVCIKNTELENEWVEDFTSLVGDSCIIPQGSLIKVYESGSIDDFLNKCRMRICSRAQKEVRDNTINTLKIGLKDIRFIDNDLGRRMLLYYKRDSGIYGKCFATGECDEPCKYFNKCISNILI